MSKLALIIAQHDRVISLQLSQLQQGFAQPPADATDDEKAAIAARFAALEPVAKQFPAPKPEPPKAQ